MSRGIIIRDVEGLVLPLSLLRDGRDVQITKSKRVAVIPDDQFDEVAAAMGGLFGTKPEPEEKKETEA